MMSQYMLLLYTTEEEERADRGGEWSMWSELNQSLEAAGLLAANGRLHGTETATTVTAMSGETELTDGPFAVTKEVLVGYYLIEAENLDQALGVAKRVPLIRYGRVEVRPVMDRRVE
jgi:hypothetical protein